MKTATTFAAPEQGCCSCQLKPLSGQKPLTIRGLLERVSKRLLERLSGEYRSD